MSDFDVKEKRFEEDIEDYLTHHGGYTKGDPKKFNRESGLEEDTFVEFIKTSQPKKWERYVKIYAENSEKQIIERFKREVKTTNLLNVMRHGFMDRGIKFYPIFWKPETSLNETTQMQYDANILHCTRQLHYSVHNENSIDIVLFANGIPVVSMELKCQFTGQDTTNAINQYKFDRAGKDAIFAFKERVLVHFAVDLTNVYMTTRLEGAHTYFLPFNQGSNGAGKVGGKGNPVNPNGYDTAYLWERVLCKDSLMEILQKYMHLQQEYDKNGNLVKETMIFPRYHQLDVVTKLLEDVKKNGSGKSYLIQHSAGSGKSNSIAWLAHRLTGLHDYEDNKIFQSVIIVTDRRVLDSQLQSTVYQFDHVEGVVKKVDKNSGQLRDAINDGVGIIITTLQKFPVIYKEVDSAKKRFAIIIDEAHSSQTGDAAKKLKRALADTEEILKEYAEMEDEDERNRKDDEDKLLDELAAQGMHKNLSFFAFTATPKGKTLQLFGQKDAEGIYRPFHIYSMRQAIEEHFILDVLQNYMTYKMYYKIAKIIEDNPEFDTTAGSKAIINYETLHPHNISQKTAIMLEHFMNVTRHKIGGRAKAMVVTPSRLHAVRYVQEFKRQIKEKGLNDLEVLVAFSGEVKDNDDVFTEEGMNKDKEGKVLLEYYKLEKDFEGPIELESTEGGYTPISGDSGHREPKKDPLTVIIDKINEKYGTHFTEMDKVLVQMENDYANQEKWQSYAKNNDRATFMLLFEKDFPNMAADRYEQNDQFFRKLFDDPDMMRQVMETVGSVLYERLKKKYIFDPKSGVIEEATPETYVEDTYLTKK